MEWGQRLGAATQSGLTPYERSAILAQELPMGAPFIRRITEIYVHYRFAPHTSALTGNKNDSELESNWQQLRPILWRAWLDRRLGRDSAPRKPR